MNAFIQHHTSVTSQEVSAVAPDLVGRNPEGQPESVRYDQVNAMLLNEFLKEHRKNEKQEATIAYLERQIEALTAEIKKMSAQIETSKFATGRIGRGGIATNIALDNH